MDEQDEETKLRRLFGRTGKQSSGDLVECWPGFYGVVDCSE